MGTPSYDDQSQNQNQISQPEISPPHAEETRELNPRRKYKRRGTGSLSDKPTDDEYTSSMSESEEHELGPLGSDAEVDEEEGLTGKERQAYLKRKRQRNALDARIAGGGGGGKGRGGLSKEEARLADKNVLRKLVVNGGLIALWYFFSLSISIYNKWMFSSDHLGFPFPLFTTSLHMLVQFLLASLILLFAPSFRPSSLQADTNLTDATRKPLVTPLFYITRLIPTGTTTSFDIGLGNASLRFITLTFYTMCKSSVLIFVLLFAFLFRLEAPSLKLSCIILAMTAGVLMMVAGETAFHALGFALAMSASFFSGFRWALTQILLLRHPATSNPFATMFFLTPIMFVALIIMALISEKPSAIVSGVYLLIGTEGLLKGLLLLFFPGCLAFCMIAAEYTLLQRTSVVTLSICGIFKEVVTISAAGIVFHDELSVVNVSGLLVTVVSIGGYNYLKVTSMRKEARAKLVKSDDHDDEEEDDDDHTTPNGGGGVSGLQVDDERRKRRGSNLTPGHHGSGERATSASVPLMHGDADDEGEERRNI